LLCGKILADLGADVIQIEPPGGSTAREIGPFYRRLAPSAFLLVRGTRHTDDITG
jgi:benzylsuccinate CoA-transferase BbsE subunit